jgi:tRNA dimethylallyltransferase
MDVSSAPPPILTITGPTGVGKTELSLDVAEHLGAEIVSVDSRQVYKELTIGTAKPPPKALERVPHHFIGERTLQEPFSAGDYAEAANERIRDIRERGRRALVVGGATLYLMPSSTGWPISRTWTMQCGLVLKSGSRKRDKKRSTRSFRR